MKRRTDLVMQEVNKPKKELEDIQHELVKKLDEIQNARASESLNFQFRGPDFERFEMILLVKGLFNFKVSWFDFEDYLPLDNYSGFINENLTEQNYKIYLGGEFFLTEYTQDAQLNLSILLKNLSCGTIVAVNAEKGIKENTQEILIVVSKDTQHIGQFLSKYSHLAVLVLSRNVLQKNTYIIDNEDMFKEESCWLQVDESEKDARDVIFEGRLENKGENKYIEKFVNQPAINEQENKMHFDKILRKHVLQNELRKLEKALKEKENSYDKFLAEKKSDINNSEKQLQGLVHQRERLEADCNEITEKFNNIKLNRESYVKTFRQNFKQQLDDEKNRLNKAFNDFKRTKDMLNQVVLNNFQESEMTLRELQDEHLKLDEKNEEIHKKKKQLREEIEIQITLNRQLEEKVSKIESEFEEKNFFAKIMDLSMKSNKETVCLICNQNRRDMVNLPCKHLTVCSKCFNKIMIPLSFKFCLVCKASVERNIKVLFEHYELIK